MVNKSNGNALKEAACTNPTRKATDWRLRRGSTDIVRLQPVAPNAQPVGISIQAAGTPSPGLGYISPVAILLNYQRKMKLRSVS